MMIKEYTLSDILPDKSLSNSFYIRHFVPEEDVEIDWPHSHSFYSFVWFTHGSGFYVIDSIEYEIKPQRVFFVVPQQIHNWSFYNNSNGYIVVIDKPISLEMDLNYGLPYIDIDESDVFLHTSILKNVIEELRFKDELSDENIKAALQYYAYLLNRIAKRKNLKTHKNNILIEEFKRLILSNNSELNTIQYYADRLNVQENKLNDTCKNTYGISAKQYMLNLKITEAKRLLIYSDQNINEIAFQVGFEDSSYFARIFKKKTDISPTLFLKKYRKYT